MKILLTGALGNVGYHLVHQLINREFEVRCFDLHNSANEKKARKIKPLIEMVWGNILDTESIKSAMQGIDVVIHLAAIIPPLSESKPELAKSVNIQGTRNIIQAIQETTPQPKLLFSSSVSLFGATQKMQPPRKVSDPIVISDNYTTTKIQCEKMIQESGLQYAILRLGAASPVEMMEMDPIMFDIPLTQRIEFIHPRDVSTAFANACTSKEVWGKILLIGGGPSCQMYYRDFLSRILDVFGIGPLPDDAFCKDKEFYTDWLDTDDSQRILNYQNTSFETYAQELAAMFRARHIFAELFRDFVKIWLLKKSVYYKSSK